MDLLEHPGIERWEVASKAAELIAGQLAQLHSELVDLMAQVLETNAWSGGGIASPEHWLMLRCALSPARAKEIVDVARRRGDFPELEARMAEGAVSLDQLAVVARHVPSTHASTVSSFVEAATVPQLRRVLPKYPFPEKAPAPHPAGYEPLPEVVHVDPPIHDEPTLAMSTYDGRFRLHFEADPLDGALVEQAIREAKDALFTAGDADATLAEGLLSVASRSLSTVESISRREHYKVLVHLDVDGHGWMNRRGTLPTHLLRKLTCDGTVRPIWIENASPVSVGRSMRIVPPRTRKLIEDRDGGCRFPGCVTTGFPGEPPPASLVRGRRHRRRKPRVPMSPPPSRAPPGALHDLGKPEHPRRAHLPRPVRHHREARPADDPAADPPPARGATDPWMATRHREHRLRTPAKYPTPGTRGDNLTAQG